MMITVVRWLDTFKSWLTLVFFQHDISAEDRTPAKAHKLVKLVPGRAEEFRSLTAETHLPQVPRFTLDLIILYLPTFKFKILQSERAGGSERRGSAAGCSAARVQSAE